MSKKQKTSMKTIVQYVRDFSIVVAGIAVTLYVNDRVTNSGEKRDLKLYLNAIKIELEENNKEIDNAKKYLQDAVNYAKYLKLTDKNARNVDTLAHYISTCCFSSSKFSFQTNAFEMFKTSGVMRLLDDKDFMLTLWKAYDDFSLTKESLDWYFQLKWTAMEKELPLILSKELKPKDIIDHPVMYNFFVFDIHSSIMKNCEEVFDNTKQALEKLEKVL